MECLSGVGWAGLAGTEVSSDLSSNDEAQLDYWELEMVRASLLVVLSALGLFTW